MPITIKVDDKWRYDSSGEYSGWTYVVQRVNNKGVWIKLLIDELNDWDDMLFITRDNFIHNYSKVEEAK